MCGNLMTTGAAGLFSPSTAAGKCALVAVSMLPLQAWQGPTDSCLVLSPSCYLLGPGNICAEKLWLGV